MDISRLNHLIEHTTFAMTPEANKMAVEALNGRTNEILDSIVKVDVHFFIVGTMMFQANECKSELISLLNEDGIPKKSEVSYIELGGILGSQRYALQLFGLGEAMGVWKVLTPEVTMPFLDKETKDQLAGQGYITVDTTKIPVA